MQWGLCGLPLCVSVRVEKRMMGICVYDRLEKMRREKERVREKDEFYCTLGSIVRMFV